MKKIIYFVGLLLVMLAFVFVVSCNDDDEESLEYPNNCLLLF